MKFENKVELGGGIYTLRDLSNILDLEYSKVQRLLNEYWDKRFTGEFVEKYSWSIKNNKAVSFHTLVEFFTFFQLKESGVSTQSILKAHKELSQIFKTPFPFAKAEILNGINCFGKKIVFEISKDEIIDLDSTKQLNLKFIKNFMHKLDFDKNNLAERLYPLGKTNSVVVDPKHQFGQPTIQGTNLFPETVFNLHNSKENKKFIASSYGITIKQVNDAIEYCKNAA
jgi:uncharacterized protein (DUF433 family)